jgi:predicted ABC-type exoprotein transport system permease subunit
VFEWLDWLEHTPFSDSVRTELWGWPLALTVHAFGTALVVGFIFIISLRLLGLFETIPYAALNRLFPVVWVALVIQFLSGFVLWMTKPTRYVADGAFMLKLSLIIVGIIVTLYFQGTIKREAASWQAKGAVSSHGIKFVAASILVWCTVLVAGRLTAFLGAIPNG